MSPWRLARAALLLPVFAACGTSGTAWMEEPLGANDASLDADRDAPPELYAPAPARGAPVRTLTLGSGMPGEVPAANAAATEGGGAVVTLAGGRVLGTFRNTYYDFPSETDYDGPSVGLMSKNCKSLGEVPRSFFEAVCVQGSGTLRRGATVSFAKRDCDCAPVCPRTGQKICFDELDPREYPWGRGATGKPITPLLTVAVDPTVIPMGTALYVPELDGLPRDPNGSAAHDGCFIAQDKGLAVVGNHVDFFTGHKDLTALWNRRVPSNRGVTVVVDSPRCARVGAVTP
ncbi:MAG TPA: 3D domain-containing protein [Polyangiaceae bacterium]|jgi:3D (Asp-Asp-Asp) domain-containing protein|nr:3D domain-containing protein [Polyangiaceae bacterium]